jgi:hypothetical protein
MEFASEIVIKAAKANLNVAEVPITYHQRTGDSKLNAVRDGWRHLRFMLLLCPKYLFIIPGLFLFVLGIVGQSALLPGPLPLGFHVLNMHFSALFAMMTLVGSQSVMFGLFSRAYAEALGLEDRGSISSWLELDFSLERGLIVGAVCFAFGFIIDVIVLAEWLQKSMGSLNAMGPALYAMTLMVLGMQIAFASFFLSLFQMKVTGPDARSV